MSKNGLKRKTFKKRVRDVGVKPKFISFNQIIFLIIIVLLCLSLVMAGNGNDKDKDKDKDDSPVDPCEGKGPTCMDEPPVENDNDDTPVDPCVGKGPTCIGNPPIEDDPEPPINDSESKDKDKDKEKEIIEEKTNYGKIKEQQFYADVEFLEDIESNNTKNNLKSKIKIKRDMLKLILTKILALTNQQKLNLKISIIKIRLL